MIRRFRKYHATAVILSVIIFFVTFNVSLITGISATINSNNSGRVYVSVFDLNQPEFTAEVEETGMKYTLETVYTADVTDAISNGFGIGYTDIFNDWLNISFKLTDRYIVQFSAQTLNYISFFGFVIVAFLIGIVLIIIVVVFISKRSSRKFASVFERINIDNDSFENIDILITEIPEISPTLDKFKLQLEQRKLYISNASHELKSPLSRVQHKVSNMLTSDDLSDKMTADLRYMEGQLEKSNAVINTLLKVSKMEAGDYNVIKSMVNINDFLSDITINYSGAFTDKNIGLIITDEKIVLNTDEELLYIIFDNIIRNATKYARKDIELKVWQDKNGVTFEIKNDGVKISEKDMPNIFEPFYSGVDGGSGLGLAMAKSAAMLLHGEVSATSNDEFTTFIVELPFTT